MIFGILNKEWSNFKTILFVGIKASQISANIQNRMHSSTICASTLTNVSAQHFKVEFDQHFVQRVVWSQLTSTLQI